MKAAQYHCTHLEKLTDVVTTIDADEAQSIVDCQKVLDNADLKISLSYISTNFTILAETIEMLETRGLALGEAVNLIENVEHKLKTLYDKQYYDKLQSVLRKNTGFSVVKEISAILSGEKRESKNEVIRRFSSSDLTAFQYAPVVSCDVERIFSVYKNILADNRRKFHFETLKQVMMIKCNET